MAFTILKINKEKTVIWGKRLTFVVILLLSLFGIWGAVFTYQESLTAWDDIHTWKNPTVMYKDLGNESKNTLTVDEESQTIQYDIEYCALYQVTISADNIEYNCSYLPYTYLKDFAFDKVTNTVSGAPIGKDFSFTYPRNTENAVFPESYLSQPVLNEDSFASDIGSAAVPVKFTADFRYEKPDKNLFSLINHYFKYRTGNFSELRTTLLSWSIENYEIPQQPDQMSASDRDKVLKEWADKALADIEKFYGIEGDIAMADFSVKDVLNKIKKNDVVCKLNSLSNNAECSTKDVSYTDTTLMLYMYAKAYSDPGIAEKIATAIKGTYFPFTVTRDEEGAIVNERISFSGYPLCPIIEIERGRLNHANVSFAREYYNRVGSWVSHAPQLVSINIINSGENNLSTVFVNNPAARAVDTVCVDFLTKNEKLTESYRFDALSSEDDKSEFHSLMLLRYLTLFKEGKTTVNISDNHLNFAAYPTDEWKQLAAEDLFISTFLHPYKYNFLSQPYTSQVVETNQNSVDNLVEYVKTGNVGLTLLVIYSIYASL